MGEQQKPVALVSGATRGIGRAIAVALGTTHHVLVGGRDRGAAEEVAAGLPSGEALVLDLADPESIAAAADSVARVDVLVNNAAIASERPITDVGMADWREALEVNFFGTVDLTTRLLEPIRTARGDIVFLNSMSGVVTYASGSPYTTTKHALLAFSDTLREEERGRGVRVSSIFPGFVATDMGHAVGSAYGVPDDPNFYLDAATVADTVRYVVDAPRTAIIESLVVRPSAAAAVPS